MSHTTDTLTKIQNAITALAGKNLAATATALIGNIGYTSPKTLAIETDPAQFLAELNIDPAKLAESLPRIKAVQFLFQLTGDELPALSRQTTPQTGASFQRGAIDSFVFLAVDLDDGAWSRRELVTIVRELNRGFAMPAIILFRHGLKATLAVIDRRANRRDPSRDVVGGRISLVKDIDLAAPHRAHVEILADLSLAAIARKKAPADFRDLYDRWIETLSAAELNKRFYAELADWFAWASTKPELVTFPKGQPADEGGKEVGLIRLLTRLMFVWFIKEKGLVTGDLFNADRLTTLLNEPPSSHPKGHDFYLAILQNLFFATLNTEMDQRRWRKEEAGQSKDYLGHHVFRHEAKFADAKAAESLFNQVPFLNGGLFECLDTEITSQEDERKTRAERERQRLILRVDGFSDQPDKQPCLQNRIFFGGEDAVDLSKYYEKAVRPRNVSGLIDLFERYKFTIEENTPLEEEAALDPELLGKVFENLLASYNEDTKTTARNKSGSFYTPREVVEFMVDEALLAYLKPKVATPADSGGIRPSAPGLDFGTAPGELGLEATGNSKAAGEADAPDRNEARLRALLDFASRTHDFSSSEVDALIAAIESCKAIDPAVGSGAFPLGLLQKLVHALAVLDPGGEKWRARNRAYYETNLSRAEAVPAPNEREAAMATAQVELDKFDAAFNSGHYPDYTRKLYLIERCLHGVDIQPIAVQIAKLRCFISLAVEQKADDSRPNRGITPLPNLETKLVAANTLTPLHRKGQMELQDKQIDITLGKLRGEFGSLFMAANGAAKRKIQTRIDGLIEQLVQLLSDDRALSSDEVKLVAQWRPFDQNSFAPFFDPELMFGLKPSVNEGWFDIVLGNPPYRQIKKGEFSKLDYPVTEGREKGKQNLYKMFVERSRQLVNPNGQVCLIVQSSLMADASATETRKMLLDKSRLHYVIEFPKKSADPAAQVFEAVLQGTCIVQFDRLGVTSEVRISHGNNTTTVLSPAWVSVAAATLRRLFPHSMVLPLIGPADLQVMETMRSASDLLETMVDVGESTKGDLNLGTNSNMISSEPTGVMLLRGAHVGRYALRHDGASWIKDGFRDDKRSVNRSKRILIGQNITGTTDPYRLIFCEVAARQEYLVGDSALKVVPRNDSDAEFILATLCSNALDWYFRKTSTNNHVNVYELLELPMPTAGVSEKTEISTVVRSIIAGAARPRLESLLNAFVYELFFPQELAARGLSPFAAAREAGLDKLAGLEGKALASAADAWSAQLADPATNLYATLFDLQSIDEIRIIEGRG